MAANQLWRWRALTKDGEPRSGTLWATDRNAAFTRLMRNDLHPLTLTRCAQRNRWRPHHCDEMFHQLATLLQAGLTLSHSLQMLAEQHPLKPWQALLQSIADELSEGCPFSESLKKWPAVFSPLHVSMVKTGELTGKLEVCCRQLAQQQKAQQQLSAKVKKALRYPAIVLTLAVLVVLAMVTLVLPEFAAIYKTFNTPLPVLTQMVMGMAAFMQSYALALFVLLLAPLAVAWALRQNPRWQCILLHTPVMGALAKGQKLGHVFTVLSLTQQAGIPFLQGLESAEETVESQYWQGILRGVREDIEKGLPVWFTNRLNVRCAGYHAGKPCPPSYGTDLSTCRESGGASGASASDSDGGHYRYAGGGNVPADIPPGRCNERGIVQQGWRTGMRQR